MLHPEFATYLAAERRQHLERQAANEPRRRTPQGAAIGRPAHPTERARRWAGWRLVELGLRLTMGVSGDVVTEGRMALLHEPSPLG